MVNPKNIVLGSALLATHALASVVTFSPGNWPNAQTTLDVPEEHVKACLDKIESKSNGNFFTKGSNLVLLRGEVGTAEEAHAKASEMRAFADGVCTKGMLGFTLLSHGITLIEPASGTKTHRRRSDRGRSRELSYTVAWHVADESSVSPTPSDPAKSSYNSI